MGLNNLNSCCYWCRLLTLLIIIFFKLSRAEADEQFIGVEELIPDHYPLDRIYLKAQPLIDEISLNRTQFDLIKSKALEIVANTLGPEYTKLFEYVSLQEFKRELLRMSRWLVDKGINNHTNAVILNYDRKSSGWVLANLIHYSQTSSESVLPLNPKHFVNRMGVRGPKDVFNVFIVDDAAYSGEQLEILIGNVCKYMNVRDRIYIGIPFISETAMKLINSLETGPDVVVYDQARSMNLFYNSTGAAAAANTTGSRSSRSYCLFAFEHKIPDDASIPPQLARGFDDYQEQDLLQFPGVTPAYKNQFVLQAVQQTVSMQRSKWIEPSYCDKGNDE